MSETDERGKGTGPVLVRSVGAPTFGAYARAMVDGRARIGRYFNPALFADPAYDMLLHLFAADQEGARVSVGGLAKAARVPQTTGLRYLALLEKEGAVERAPDRMDRRRALLRLTPAARTAMAAYLADLSSLPLRR